MERNTSVSIEENTSHAKYGGGRVEAMLLFDAIIKQKSSFNENSATLSFERKNKRKWQENLLQASNLKPSIEET